MFGFGRKPSLPSSEEKSIIDAIRNAETGTSAEIRVHLVNVVKYDTVLEHSQIVFKKLGMHKTELRNGILIFIAIQDHQFAIVGDVAIHQCVTDAFWEEVKNEMSILFKSDSAGKAISHGVTRAGEKLKHYFPANTLNPNELSDEISRG
jgi:uncharacterized membrane protein